MIYRKLYSKIREHVSSIPVIAILGPRQSGKTTLAKAAFPEYKFISLEDKQTREQASNNPKQFLDDLNNETGVILDEIQYVPDLFSYIKMTVDETGKNGFFVITGSQNYLMNEAISQSLAGRVLIYTLLPLSINELKEASLLQTDVNDLIFKGGYPRLYVSELTTSEWSTDYIQTYLERDIRQLKNTEDLSQFQDFLKVCVGRIGQLFDIESISNDISVDTKTVKRWISLLEQSYIIFRVRPYFKNFGKRMLKTSKIYFYDTGLAYALLEIKSSQEIDTHDLRGGLFESFIMSELLKIQYNKKERPFLYFWQNNKGNEVDGIIEKANHVIRIEMKASKAIRPSLLKGLKEWNNNSKVSDDYSFLVYGGNESRKENNVQITSWKDVGNILN